MLLKQDSCKCEEMKADLQIFHMQASEMSRSISRATSLIN